MENEQAQQLYRRFKLGSTLIDDPAPDEPVEQSARYLEKAYPVIARCMVSEEPTVEGEYLVYELIKPAATTKGQGGGEAAMPFGTSGDAQLDRELAEWAAPADVDPGGACPITQAWSRAAPLLLDLARQASDPSRMPAAAIPLA